MAPVREGNREPNAHWSPKWSRAEESASSSSTARSERTKRRVFRRKNVTLPDYDGTYEAGIFLRQLDKLVEVNGWDEEERCAHLMVCLKGEARAVLGRFSSNERLTVGKIERALTAKFGKEMPEDVALARLVEVK